MSASKHRAEGVARVRPVDRQYRPKHCAGTGCFHTHPGDVRCACRQVVLPPAESALTLTMRNLNAEVKVSPVPIRHTADGCHVVTPASRTAVPA